MSDNYKPTRWTDDKISMLKKFWPEHSIPTREIAMMLGYGFNKNMVIGKAHRLGLTKRREPTHVGRHRPSLLTPRSFK